MEPVSRGSRYPAPQRVSQKLDAAISISLPHRPRSGACDRDNVVAEVRLDSDVLSNINGSDKMSSIDASSLVVALTAAADSNSLNWTSASSTDSHATQNGLDVPHIRRDERSSSAASFRKHQRGVCSIDSILSSTTCVNTQSECSRPPSRASRSAQYESDATRGYLMLEEAAKLALISSTPRPVADSGILTPTPRAPGLSPSSSTFIPAMIYGDGEGEDSVDEEARMINELSSLVLRTLLGKEVDECSAPLLIEDCTYRYVQELSTVANEGVLRHAGATPPDHQGSTSPYGGLGYGLGGGNQDDTGFNGAGKGKRKAGGSDEGGDGHDERDSGRDKDGNLSTGVPRSSTKLPNSNGFSCPYRKRNPLRFNVRDYYVCATHSFADMSQLK